MASGEDKKYDLQDKLDEFLAQSIAKYVLQSTFSTFATALGVPKRKMDTIMAPNAFQPDERVKQVS